MYLAYVEKIEKHDHAVVGWIAQTAYFGWQSSSEQLQKHWGVITYYRRLRLPEKATHHSLSSIT